MPVVYDTLCLDRIEHLLLIGERPDLQARERNGDSAVLRPTGGLGECIVEPITIPVGLVLFEARVVPICVERRRELLQERRSSDA